jgi:ketopantoate reductase
MKNRKSEVENINGWVVEQQEKQDKTAPVNAAIVEISARIKRGTLKPGLANLELLKKLVEGS